MSFFAIFTSRAITMGRPSPLDFWVFEPEDFEDIVIMWGEYDTEEKVKASPYYTQTTIDVDPWAKLQFPDK
jgi:hypothetical protein